jgi:hypothetical protein
MGDILPNPWTESAQYDRFGIAGVTFVGGVDLDAGALLKKKSDHRRARGRNGGRSVSTGWDLVEFTVTLSAWEEIGFAVLQEILRRVGRGAVATQDTAALRVSHPYLGAVSITQVTLEGAGFVPVQGGGRLGLKLSLKEWRAPTQAPGARAPAAATQATTGRPPAKDIPNTGTLTALGARQEGAEWRQEGREIPLRPTPPAAPSADP